MEEIKNANRSFRQNIHHSAASFIKELNPFALQSRPN
jgi:hypothetical protein